MDKIKDFLSNKRNVIALVSAIVVVGIICVVVGSNSKDDKKTATSGNVKVEKETTLKIEKESTTEKKIEETTTAEETTTVQETTVEETTTSNPVTPMSKTMFVTGSSNVRAGYSGNDEIIGKLQLNNQVEITGKVGEWYQINYNGSTAYIHESLLSDTEIETQAPTERQTEAVVNNQVSNSNSNAGQSSQTPAANPAPDNSNPAPAPAPSEGRYQLTDNTKEWCSFNNFDFQSKNINELFIMTYKDGSQSYAMLAYDYSEETLKLFYSQFPRQEFYGVTQGIIGTYNGRDVWLLEVEKY